MPAPQCPPAAGMRRMDFSAAVVMVMWGWIIVVSSLG
jgi:hypothetical protein